MLRFTLQGMGFMGIQFAHPLAWLFGDILLIPAFFYCMKKVNAKTRDMDLFNNK